MNALSTPLRRSLLTGLVAVACLAGPPAAAVEASSGPPGWFLDHIEFITRDGGCWITDNSAYRSEDEPFAEYGMIWSKGIGGKSLKGRLFGLVDGREVATFWEFRTVWHPRDNRVQVYQWGGNGTFASGTMIATGDGTHRSEQEFIRPDGSAFGVGHDATEEAADTYLTQSSDIQADGSWVKRRSYVWKRAGRDC